MIGELKNTGTIEVDGKECNFNRTKRSSGQYGFTPIQMIRDGRPVRELSVPAIFYANVKFRTGGHWFYYPAASLKAEGGGQDVD